MPIRTLIFGLTIAAQMVSAQVPPPADSPEPTFKLSVTADLVLLDVSVRSVTGDHFSNLTKGNFKVYEDGKLQIVSHFATEDAPVTAGLVIDSSGSMRHKRPVVVTAAVAFLDASNRNDEVFVVHFSDGVSLGLPADVPFTGDLQLLHTALWRGTPEGRTALNDAIVFSLRHLEQGRRERAALVLVSDGGDNSSVHSAEEVMRAVLESHATIYTIGVFDETDHDNNPDLLRHLARISGGESFLQVQLSAVTGICQQIASDIRKRYTIGYVPIRSGEPGSVRKIRVIVSEPGRHKLVVHTRTRYVLPARLPSADQDCGPSRKRGL